MSTLGADDGGHQVILPGALVAGRYRVGSLIGAGGMGVVVEASDEMLGRRVALKLLGARRKPAEDALAERPASQPGRQGPATLSCAPAPSPADIERLLREARAAARIDSEHVVQVYDVGVTEQGLPYIVMERLEGHDLEREQSQRAPLAIAEAVDYTVQALDALRAAHARGIVHRDLKPSNVFVVRRPGRKPSVKLLDFGISKLDASHDNRPALTDSRSLLGSPGYMSPEQIKSPREVDARTDLWSLGVILYELLTGEAAYDGETIGQVFARIREEDLPPLRSRRAGAPSELEAVLRRCLSRDRAERYPSAEALSEALLPFASERVRGEYRYEPPTAGEPPPPPPARSEERTRSGGSAWSATQRTSGTRAQRRVLFLVGIALLAGTAIAWWSVRSPLTPAPPAPERSASEAALEPAVAASEASRASPPATATATSEAGPPARTAEPVRAAPPVAAPRPVVTPAPSATAPPGASAASPAPATTFRRPGLGI